MWGWDYYVLKTTSANDAIALVRRLCPTGDSFTCNFTLWYPEHVGTDREFLPLVATILLFEEYTTHRDAFETLKEVDIVKDVYDNSSLVHEVLVRKKDEPDISKVSNPSE